MNFNKILFSVILLVILIAFPLAAEEASKIGAKNGTFMVNGDRMSLEELMMKINLDRQNQLDRQIMDQMNKIKQGNSDSQLEMIKLQNLMNKRNQAMTMQSNISKKNNDTKKAIIGNMR